MCSSGSRKSYQFTECPEQISRRKFRLSKDKWLPDHLGSSLIPTRTDPQDLENSRSRRSSLPVTVVVKFVVTGKCNQDSKSSPQGKKYLSCSINPYLKPASKNNHLLLPIKFHYLTAWVGLGITRDALDQETESKAEMVYHGNFPPLETV
jgi:hypothetical protein